jgi:hypothetical protein
MWTCVSFGSKYRTLTHGEERTPEPQGKGGSQVWAGSP